MKVALCVGGAVCVWDDLAELERLVGGAWSGVTLAVNEVGAAYPGRLDHWVSLHPEKFRLWEPQRRGNTDYIKWGGTWERQSPPPGTVDRVIPVWGVGTSVMHAIAVAFTLQIPKIVIAGTPLDASPHFHSDKPWKQGRFHHKAWTDHYPKMKDRVRSMSGWTRELLGPPTKEWLGLD